MTDLQKFVELYKGFGIECEVNELGDTGGEGYSIHLNDGYGVNITRSNKFTESYIGFFSVVTFNHRGKFIKQSFFE